VASIRDYDEVLRDRPSGDAPRRFASGGRERIVFQVWDWISGDQYTLRHFLMDGTASGWSVTERTTTCRALPRATVSDSLVRAGFQDVAWRMPRDTGYYQPVVAARAAG
jgi:hypothetical protein